MHSAGNNRSLQNYYKFLRTSVFKESENLNVRTQLNQAYTLFRVCEFLMIDTITCNRQDLDRVKSPTLSDSITNHQSENKKTNSSTFIDNKFGCPT